jgi:putative DNA primase/helicase
MPVLTQRLETIGGAALCIVDPVVSAVVGDGHKSNDVRRGLQPLVELAMALECALIGISHFSKGTGGRDPLERVTGSIAYGALARVVLVAAKEQRSEDEHKPERRVLMRAKSNIGSDAGGFEYSLNQEPVPDHEGMFASVASFGSPIEGTAREVLSDAEAEDTGDRSVFDEAHDWLLDFLIDGPKPTKQIKTEASAAGHSWATVKRAKVKLNIRAKKVGLDQGWEWVLPGPEF